MNCSWLCAKSPNEIDPLGHLAFVKIPLLSTPPPSTVILSAMSVTTQQLAEQIGASVRGDGERILTGCAGIDAATAEQVSFLANRKYIGSLSTTKAGVCRRPAASVRSPGLSCRHGT